MKQLLKSTLIALTATLSLSVQAVEITFGGVNPGDGSFLTSALAPTNSINPALGIFNETFDSPNGCQVNSVAQGIKVTGNFWLTTGASSKAAAPANDKTCYASGPAQLMGGGAANNSATIDWTDFLATNLPGKRINYLGLYWGSIDRYNDITFYAQGKAINIASINGSALNKTKLNGADILQFGGTAGDRASPNTNRYVNLWFNEDEQFDKLVFSSTNYAFEMDNLVIRVAGVAEEVPAPSSLALIGLALIGLSLRRRK